MKSIKLREFVRLALFIVLLSGPKQLIFAQVGIGTTTPNASSILDLTATDKGLLIPRMTASQRAAILSPATGLIVFQTDAPAGNYIYNGTSWTIILTAT